MTADAVSAATDTVSDAVMTLSATKMWCGLIVDVKHQYSRCNDADVSNQCF
jgi:hypothetical protein